MNVYAWLDNAQQWQVSHRPPNDPSINVLMIALPPGDMPIFLDWKRTTEVEVMV